MPSATIILITHNGQPYLEECLDSLRRALLPGAEVVVVDNASTDGSAELVRARMPEAKLVVNAVNCGFAAACNQGAAMARGEILVFLNQDTRVERDWLRALLKGFRDDSVGLVTSTVLWMDRPDRVQSCGQDIHYTGLVFGRAFGVPRAEVPAPAEIGAVSGVSFAVRREVWDALGGLCEPFFMYYEETDLSWRARRAGYRCVHVPDSVVYHAGRTDRPGPAALYWSYRNRALAVLRNWRWSTLLLLLPALILAEALEWALALARGQAGLWAKGRAVGWLLAHPREVARIRAEAREPLRARDREMLARMAWRLEPRVVTGGRIGRALIALCNGLFYLNGWLARRVLRLWEGRG